MSQEKDERIMQNLFFRLSPFLNQHQSASGILICEVAASNEYLGILKPKLDLYSGC